ncbi:MAG: CAP domain-containing protein, partial [Bacteroidales bacterium]|nr:CAP domain-containing protein [Bacteroidales bacterium]
MREFCILIRRSLYVALSFSCIYVYSQSGDYEDFNTERLKSNKQYTWNFNPIDYDPSIIDACVIDVINLARNQYNFADPLILNESLENAAKLQSEFMAKKEERTHTNVVKILQTPELRSVSTGGSKRVTELVTRAKATQGIEEYSYLDISTEIISSLLKNKKTVNTLLDKRYTIIGVGCHVDSYNKYCYVSIVFGNDLSFNKADISYKKTVYTRKTYGLKPYDEKICRKCQVRNIELFQSYLEVKGTDVYFVHPNLKALKRIISKNKDGLAIDFVQHSQMPCNGANNFNYNYYNRGAMPKYMTFKKMIKKNELTGKKEKGIRVYLGTAPNTVEAPFDVNVIIIKDKTVCRTVVKTNVSQPNISYEVKTSLIPDLNGIQTTINYIPEPEKTVLEFKVPFERNKYVYEAADIKPFIDALKESRFIVDSIYITAFTSLEGNDKANLELQKKRSESIVSAMEQLQDVINIPYLISLNDGWDLFQKDVISTQYKHLANKSKEDVKATLNQGKIKKDLEHILAQHRYAHIRINATYDVSEQYEQEFLTNKFNRTLAAGNLPLAFAIQKYMMKKVEEGTYKKSFIEALEIPNTVQMIPFLTNKYYMLSFFETGLSSDDMEKVIALQKMDSKNTICEFNALACSIDDVDITTTAQVSTWQGKIDRIYN